MSFGVSDGSQPLPGPAYSPIPAACQDLSELLAHLATRARPPAPKKLPNVRAFCCTAIVCPPVAYFYIEFFFLIFCCIFSGSFCPFSPSPSRSRRYLLLLLSSTSSPDSITPTVCNDRFDRVHRGCAPSPPPPLLRSGHPFALGSLSSAARARSTADHRPPPGTSSTHPKRRCSSRRYLALGLDLQ